jgi:hypothetical protein
VDVEALDRELMDMTDEQALSFVADDVVEEREAAGTRIIWPEEDEVDETLASEYPPAIWHEAERRWAAMSPQDQEDYKETSRAELREMLLAMKGDIAGEVMEDSFDFLDILFFGLAVITALGVGSGGAISLGGD